MLVNDVKDNIMLLKESFKERVLNNYFQRGSKSAQIAQDIIKGLGLNSLRSRIIAKQGTTIIIADNRVIRLPHDEMNRKRCMTNRDMLIRLRKTRIAHLTPSFIGEGEIRGQFYFCETRLPGAGIDIPISRMDDMVNKAAGLITDFHKDTARDIIVDEAYFKNLFSKEFSKLSQYLNEEYKVKLNRIEAYVKEQLFYKKLKTVWMHGDYKIENILFDTKTWQIKGIIDWDLSRIEGLPLLDIFYLLAYKDSSLITKQGVANILKNRYIKQDFSPLEKPLIEKYLNSLSIDKEFLMPLLAAFWLQHISCRYSTSLTCTRPDRSKWLHENVYDVIDAMTEQK